MARGDHESPTRREWSNVHLQHSAHSGSRNTQRARILELLIQARGEWVSLPAILELHISQFGARILELRRLGFPIENQQETIEGQRHSRYRLPLGATPQPELCDIPTTGTFPEFGDIAPEAGYPD